MIILWIRKIVLIKKNKIKVMTLNQNLRLLNQTLLEIIKIRVKYQINRKRIVLIKNKHYNN